jgi:hypothetical protein
MRPISSRSPLPSSFTIADYGSPFLVRYVSVRLAVPQTSWNLHHYAPGRRNSQTNSAAGIRFSSEFNPLFFNLLPKITCSFSVDKTGAWSPVVITKAHLITPRRTTHPVERRR